jgi:hypothetical protein
MDEAAGKLRHCRQHFRSPQAGLPEAVKRHANAAERFPIGKVG